MWKIRETLLFIQTDVNGQSLDLGFGLYYIHKNWYVGASVQHLNAPLVELGGEERIADR